MSVVQLRVSDLPGFSVLLLIISTEYAHELTYVCAAYFAPDLHRTAVFWLISLVCAAVLL